MLALIFNSGTGSRLGGLTAHSPKAMVRLLNSGETIFERQLRILRGCGITDFVVTTGPFPEQLEEVAAPYVAQGCRFEFVANPRYDETNYIYSMYCARQHLRGRDILMLHGDLVFDAAYARAVIEAPLQSLGSVNKAIPQPAKDFKARVIDGEVREVGVDLFDADCYAFQPFYKLSRQAVDIWLAKVEEFCEAGDTKVYAE
ncbi:MAG: NTP transferase domain-containing protein, partial [Eggerthellaceae bacterium]|nr:NTP transferase domain-containing protein [Eggerthellaceae bacterium]